MAERQDRNIMKDMQGKKKSSLSRILKKAYLSEAYRKIRWDTN